LISQSDLATLVSSNHVYLAGDYIVLSLPRSTMGEKGPGNDSMSEEGTYHLRRNLEYVKQKPKFIQNILKKGDAQEAANSERRLRNTRTDDEPVLVDSEGNSIPMELLEKDRILDSAFSGIIGVKVFTSRHG
jgi:hypothetical protein